MARIGVMTVRVMKTKFGIFFEGEVGRIAGRSDVGEGERERERLNQV